jgi:AhpD family alkylhydroperoxidase
MASALAAMTPPEPRYSVTPPDADRAKPMNMLGVLAHHPALARAYFTFGGHVLMATSLTERQRELLALRTSALCSCDYEWAQHFTMGRDAGLSDEEISRIAFGPDAPFWDELDRAILRANDELFHVGVISDDTWAALSDGLDYQQILDLIFTVGSYETLARMMRSVELQLEDGYVVDVTGQGPAS